MAEEKASEQEHVWHVDSVEFEKKILQADRPALVDFWAPWCGPCRMIAPTIEQLAREYEGRVIVAKVNTDHNGELAMSYGIQGIPTLLFIKDGEVVDRIIGAVGRQVLVAKLEKLLGGVEAAG